MVCYQAKKLIYERLKEEVENVDKDETSKTSYGWVSLCKSLCNWHSTAESREAESANKEAVSLDYNRRRWL